MNKLTSDRKSIRKAKRHDRFARWTIVLGGVTIIASVVAILVLIVSVTLPLFRSARAELLVEARLPESLSVDRVVGLGVDINLSEEGIRSLSANILDETGTLTFLDIDPTDNSHDRELRVVGQEMLSDSKNATIRGIERFAGSLTSVFWSDGTTSVIDIQAETTHEDGKRLVNYRLERLADMPREGDLATTNAIMRCSEDPEEGNKALTTVRALADGRLSVVRESTIVDSLFGEEKTTRHHVVIDDIPGPVGAMTMNREGTTLYVGTKNGCLAWWDFDPEAEILNHDVVPAFTDKREITSMAMILGDVSLAVGDEKGGLTTWFRVRGAGQGGTPGSAKLRLIHQLENHAAGVAAIHPSNRNKSVMSLGEDGKAHLDYMTSERHLLSLSATNSLRTLGFATKGDALAGVDDQGRLSIWRIDNPHPEVGWRTLFGSVFYEGYPEPEHVWQTTGGEEFEPKFGLIPLLFGTLKGTAYAMLFAVPLALLAAAYTSHFTTPRFKATIKPVVEIMAAVPSVVIGFLIALWLAPIIERGILAVFASMVTIPASFISFMLLWQVVRRWDWAKRVENGREFLMLVPVVLVGAVLAIWLAAPIERVFFEDNFTLWLFETLDMRYDQRNCIIIAFGLGFAVIPIIFSIAEDSLSNVPHSLTAASMAMGASRWQTLWRVVLPSASPGIFAATMIGFGRAVGETMIVLMATGNTAIIDASPFNGMRTLSANIAVEIIEAPVGGTLFRVLFLCAVLLFMLTFALNTAAELVRHRLRKQYGQF